MRTIVKAAVPACLQSFIQGQLAIQPHPVNVTYRDFPSKTGLREILTAEQYGLCGYTGTPVDYRIAHFQENYCDVAFCNHIEHLKCQQACRVEVAKRGEVYGQVVAEDLDYRNMIAALEVRGAEVEHFGAVAKAAKLLPVLPTDANCQTRFTFLEGDGGVEGLDADAAASIDVLALNHDTLRRWRLSALSIWLDPLIIHTRDDFMAVLAAVTMPINGVLPEFAFVIESVAKGYLHENDL